MIIVLYRTELPASPTVQSLLECNALLSPRDKLVIWDNSPDAQQADAVAAVTAALACAVEYRHTAANVSLASIYNRVFQKNPDYDLLCIFDQDSSFGRGYFEQTAAAALQYADVNLFVPLIYAGKTIISPGHFFYFKGRYWNVPQTGLVKARNSTAIASGMCIRMAYLLSSGGFEERLKLYGIDTNFMLRYAKRNKFFFVFGTPFGHALAEHDGTEDKAAKRRRFEDFKRASLINAGLFPLPVRWLTRLFLWYRSVRF